jgi:hypothetical protein
VKSSVPARGLRGVLIALAVLTLSWTGAVGALAAPSGVAVTSDAPVFWNGTADVEDRTFAEVPACRTAGCDRTKLRVTLPRDLRERSGGVQVAIRWSDPSASLGLHAVRDGQIVASSTGQIGVAQSILLPKRNGTYTIYVSHQPFDPSAAPARVAYEGLAENEDAPAVEPVRDLLPDLHALPQRLVTFQTPGQFFDDSAPEGSNCFASEINEQEAELCLRFGQAAENIGDGPLDMRYSADPGDRLGEAPATQRIYASDGSFEERAAGFMHYHAAHQHFHFEGFSQSWLYPLDDDGDAGAVPAATGRKNGFCMADTEMAWWGLKGDAPQTFPAPRCLSPIGQEDGRDLYKNGISVGWADEYMWNLPDQMIEVSDLSDGRYRLVTRVDADDRIVESDETNNCIALDVELTDLASQPAVEIVDAPRPCA